MGEQFVQQTDPEEVFTALADETRLKILQALWDVDPQSATFSELREAVGMRDSGRFNYHLDKLLDWFVTKTDGDYQLTQAGKHVNGAIASGIYTGHGTIDPIEVNSSCRVCSGDHTLQYENEVARIKCDSCPASWTVPVPPAALAGYDREDIPQVVSQYFRTKFQQIINGFCSYCNGQMQPTVGPIDVMDVGATSPEEPSEAGDDDPSDHPVVQFDCQRCGATAGIELDYGLLLAHPGVTGLYYEHGIDLRDCLLWDVKLDPDRAEIVGRNPIQACVTFRVEDAQLTVTVDETFNVIDIDT